MERIRATPASHGAKGRVASAAEVEAINRPKRTSAENHGIEPPKKPSLQPVTNEQEISGSSLRRPLNTGMNAGRPAYAGELDLSLTRLNQELLRRDWRIQRKLQIRGRGALARCGWLGGSERLASEIGIPRLTRGDTAHPQPEEDVSSAGGGNWPALGLVINCWPSRGIADVVQGS